MRTLGIMVLTLGTAAALTAPAQAQGFRGRGMMGGYMLLSNKSVQQELKLDDQQVEKANKVVEEVGAKAREKMQDIPQEERREKGAQVFREANEEIKAALKDVIKPGQITRLEQISRQVAGIQAFSDPAVESKLKLTSEQKSKIEDISRDTMERGREIFTNAGDDRAAAMEKLTALRKESFGKALAVLTDDQKKTWKELTGEPFEVKFEPRPNA
jgi:hypothetical protein